MPEQVPDPTAPFSVAEPAPSTNGTAKTEYEFPGRDTHVGYFNCETRAISTNEPGPNVPHARIRAAALWVFTPEEEPTEAHDTGRLLNGTVDSWNHEHFKQQDDNEKDREKLQLELSRWSESDVHIVQRDNTRIDIYSNDTKLRSIKGSVKGQITYRLG